MDMVKYSHKTILYRSTKLWRVMHIISEEINNNNNYVVLVTATQYYILL